MAERPDQGAHLSANAALWAERAASMRRLSSTMQLVLAVVVLGYAVSLASMRVVLSASAVAVVVHIVTGLACIEAIHADRKLRAWRP